MTFEEFLKQNNYKGYRNYVKWVNEVCENMNKTLNNLTLKNIDSVIDAVKNDNYYIRKGHGNSHATALKKYKEYLLYINGQIILSSNINKIPPMGEDENVLFIRYADDVKNDERITGLCHYLECEYERIVAFARNLFGNDLTEFERIPVILKKELPIEKHYFSAEAKAKMIERKYKHLGPNLSHKEIKRIIETDCLTFSIYGRYFGLKNNSNHEPDLDRPYIVLYYKNIGTDDLELYKAKIAQTLAHEYMHHIHEVIAWNTFNSKEKYAKDVKEAVADFFGVLYSIWSHRNDKKIESALATYNSWVDYFGSDWPYSNALWHFFINGNFFGFDDKYDYYVINCLVKKFLNVVYESKYDMNSAYSVLTL